MKKAILCPKCRKAITVVIMQGDMTAQSSTRKLFETYYKRGYIIETIADDLIPAYHSDKDCDGKVPTKQEKQAIIEHSIF